MPKTAQAKPFDFFTSDSHTLGIKQQFNDLTTTARINKKKLADWLIELHFKGRSCVINTVNFLAAAFEKTISQHISTQNPLKNKECSQRDQVFLLNLMWLLEGWQNVIASNNANPSFIGGSPVNDTIQIFNGALQRMATAISQYTYATTTPRIRAIQQAATTLQEVLKKTPTSLTKEGKELQTMLPSIITSIVPRQLAEITKDLTTKIEATQSSLFLIEPFPTKLSRELANFKQILGQPNTAETTLMPSVIKKLQELVGQPEQKITAHGLFHDIATSWPPIAKPCAREAAITEKIEELSQKATFDQITRELIILLEQERNHIMKLKTEQAEQYFLNVIGKFSTEVLKERLIQLKEALQSLPNDATIEPALIPKVRQLLQKEIQQTNQNLQMQPFRALAEKFLAILNRDNRGLTFTRFDELFDSLEARVNLEEQQSSLLVDQEALLYTLKKLLAIEQAKLQAAITADPTQQAKLVQEAEQTIRQKFLQIINPQERARAEARTEDTAEEGVSVADTDATQITTSETTSTVPLTTAPKKQTNQKKTPTNNNPLVFTCSCSTFQGNYAQFAIRMTEMTKRQQTSPKI